MKIKVYDTEINVSNVYYWISLFKQGRQETLKKLDSFYEGTDDIGKIVSGNNRINNKVHVNLARMITKNATDYFIGEPVAYSYSDEFEGTDRYNYVDDLQFRNLEDTENKDLAKDCSKFGKAFELINIKDDKTLYYKRLDPMFTFDIWSVGILPERICTITYQTYKPRNKTEITEGFVYTNNQIIPFKINYRTTTFGEAIDNVFGKIPVIFYLNNSDEKGDYESVTDLLTAYNKLMSCAVDDYESISNAILLIRDSKQLDDETKESLNSTRVLQLFSPDAEMAFINKTLDSEFVKMLREAIREDILTVTNVPDFTDKNFAGDNSASGIALRYKLIGFENLRADKEVYFIQALMRRWEVISQYPAAKFDIKRDDIKIDMFPNLPNNIELDLELTKLYNEGAISRQTLLEKLQTVKDAKEEERRLDDEKRAVTDYVNNTEIPDLKV